MNPYQVLGVSKNANEKEIDHAFKKRAKVLHPDRIDKNKKPEDWKTANDMFRELIEAYETLRDPDKKAIYDLSHQEKPTRTDKMSGADSKKATRKSAGEENRPRESQTSEDKQFVQPKQEEVRIFQASEDLKKKLEQIHKNESLSQISISARRFKINALGDDLFLLLFLLFILHGFLIVIWDSFLGGLWLFLLPLSFFYFPNCAYIAETLVGLVSNKIKPTISLTESHIIQNDYHLIKILPLNQIIEWGSKRIKNKKGAFIKKRIISIRGIGGFDVRFVAPEQEAALFMQMLKIHLEAWNSACEMKDQKLLDNLNVFRDVPKEFNRKDYCKFEPGLFTCLQNIKVFLLSGLIWIVFVLLPAIYFSSFKVK